MFHICPILQDLYPKKQFPKNEDGTPKVDGTPNLHAAAGSVDFWLTSKDTFVLLQGTCAVDGVNDPKDKEIIDTYVGIRPSGTCHMILKAGAMMVLITS
jgi:hypothetical protein